MSKYCRKCGKEMPKNRKGYEQICPECLLKKAQKITDKLPSLNNFLSEGRDF